jgi:hypothetical protein
MFLILDHQSLRALFEPVSKLLQHATVFECKSVQSRQDMRALLVEKLNVWQLVPEFLLERQLVSLLWLVVGAEI